MFKFSWEVDEKFKILVINVDKNNDIFFLLYIIWVVNYIIYCNRIKLR